MADGDEEVLARLNPGSLGTEPTPAATGDRLDAATVAQAAALIQDRIGALLLIIRVADQWSWYLELERRVAAEALELAREKGWRVQTPRSLAGMMTHLARIAIFEHCIPGLCRHCKGRGKRYPSDGPVRDCERCDGTGRHNQMSERDRAREVGLSPNAWLKTWSARYSLLQRMLVGHDAVAVDQLRRLLRTR